MSDARESALAVMRLLADVMRRLQPDQLDQLIEGKAKLAFVPPGATVVATGPDVDQVRAELDRVTSRHEAAAYLSNLKLKKAELLSLARQLDVAAVTKDTVPVLHHKIVEATVGAREDSAAIRER